jgi:hypothetical protein
MLLLCLPFFTITGSFVEMATWDAFALVVGLGTSNKLVVTWKQRFHMYDDVILVPEEPPLYVVRFEYFWWLAFTAWIAENGTSAPPLCDFVKGYP